MLGYLLLWPRQLLYIAGGWRGPLIGKGFFWGGGDPPQKILGLFHFKWLILVQIPLYILTMEQKC